MTTENSRADALTEAVTRTIETIKRQLDLIADRAPGDFLDKRPVVQSLGAHVRRLEKALAEAESLQPAAAPIHSDDACVDQFAASLKSKLALARAKGRSGWQQCDPTELSIMLREHVEKGDPRDVANFCMFLWALGKPISDAALPMGKRAAPSPADERAAFVKLMGYDRPETEGVAVDVWDSQRATWLEALAFARAASANETEAEGATYRAGIEAVAKFIDKKAADYLDECGYVEHDTGAVSWGSGNHADAKRDYHSALVELAEEIRATLKGDDHA
ncbi:hypothetical protein [Burkholderia cenocepacia]|uniref:hypothetical protein n=1 Tax=Burkholderia cenocepacia TaxID=95486 RepID=UPI0038478663